MYLLFTIVTFQILFVRDEISHSLDAQDRWVGDGYGVERAAEEDGRLLGEGKPVCGPAQGLRHSGGDMLPAADAGGCPVHVPAFPARSNLAEQGEIALSRSGWRAGHGPRPQSLWFFFRFLAVAARARGAPSGYTGMAVHKKTPLLSAGAVRDEVVAERSVICCSSRIPRRWPGQGAL